MKQTTLALAFAAFTVGLHAQTATDAPASTEPEASQLPTTVVTGSLWESDLQKTTASISVIDSAQIESSGAQHFGDIINSLSNVTWTGGTSRPQYIQIRGIGENSQFEGETPDSSVRFMVDDLDFTGLGSVGNLFDVQQVEVLRGPQAGAFGVNAAGGVIKIVTNEPTPYWTGQVEGTAGEDSLVAGGVAVGGPVIESDPERLTFRLSAYQLNQDGFRHNKFLGKDDTNERDEFNTRLKLRWLANEDWQWDATAFYANTDNGYDEWSLENTEFDTYSDYEGRDEQESFASSIRGTWTGLDSINVTTITSYTDTDSSYGFDGDWSDAASVTFPDPDNPGDFIDYSSFLETDRERERWSQEIRLDSVDKIDTLGFVDRWTTGIYFEDFSEDTSTTGFGDFDTTYETQTISLYGQGTHLISDRTRVTLGLRAEYYDLTTDLDYREDVDFDEWLFGGKLTLEHDLSDTKTTFASITKGYKAGGANIYPFLPDSAPVDYDSEDLWNYEVGLRASWFDEAVVSQLTLFYLDRDDAQLRDSDGEGVEFAYFTTNGNQATHYGAEAEATWFINKAWSINASLGLLETDRDSYTDPRDPNPTVESRDLANAPTYTYSARIDYVAENGFFANLEVTGSDEYYESNSHNEKRSSFTQFNGAIGYRYNNWTFTVWGRNLFDEEYEKRIFYFPNEAPDYAVTKRYENPADPQQFGATVNYRW